MQENANLQVLFSQVLSSVSQGAFTTENGGQLARNVATKGATNPRIHCYGKLKNWYNSIVVIPQYSNTENLGDFNWSKC